MKQIIKLKIRVGFVVCIFCTNVFLSFPCENCSSHNLHNSFLFVFTECNETKLFSCINYFISWTDPAVISYRLTSGKGITKSVNCDHDTWPLMSALHHPYMVKQFLINAFHRFCTVPFSIEYESEKFATFKENLEA